VIYNQYQQAIEYLKESKGHFDYELLDIFLKNIDKLYVDTIKNDCILKLKIL
jgi:HD-GYP domain-containing protein (c-di-GMP phosphodiesterase class II)